TGSVGTRASTPSRRRFPTTGRYQREGPLPRAPRHRRPAFAVEQRWAEMAKECRAYTARYARLKSAAAAAAYQSCGHTSRGADLVQADLATLGRASVGRPYQPLICDGILPIRFRGLAAHDACEELLQLDLEWIAQFQSDR